MLLLFLVFNSLCILCLDEIFFLCIFSLVGFSEILKFCQVEKKRLVFLYIFLHLSLWFHVVYIFNIYNMFFFIVFLSYFLSILISVFNLDIFYRLFAVSNLILYPILYFSDWVFDFYNFWSDTLSCFKSLLKISLLIS